jgi:hypothetical protein
VKDTKSLGDEATFGDAGGDDEPFDDGMEVVDLSARYTIEDTLGKGGMGEVLLAPLNYFGATISRRVMGRFSVPPAVESMPADWQVIFDSCVLNHSAGLHDFMLRLSTRLQNRFQLEERHG